MRNQRNTINQQEDSQHYKSLELQGDQQDLFIIHLVHQRAKVVLNQIRIVRTQVLMNPRNIEDTKSIIDYVISCSENRGYFPSSPL